MLMIGKRVKIPSHQIVRECYGNTVTQFNIFHLSILKVTQRPPCNSTSDYSGKRDEQEKKREPEPNQQKRIILFNNIHIEYPR